MGKIRTGTRRAKPGALAPLSNMRFPAVRPPDVAKPSNAPPLRLELAVYDSKSVSCQLPRTWQTLSREASGPDRPFALCRS